jgi:hypothetical protein
MSITVAQIFQIGSVLITLASVLLGLEFDPKVTSVISAAILTAWNAVGAILTTPGQQAQRVADNIDSAAVKAVVVPAVANLPGVSAVQLNAKADDTLKALGAGTEEGLAKILSPR